MNEKQFEQLIAILDTILARLESIDEGLNVGASLS